MTSLFGEEMTNVFGEKIVKALTWKEPFASLMLHGKIETRKWDTRYRGPVLICASQLAYSDSEVFNMCGHALMSSIIKTLGADMRKNYRSGYAFAVADLVNTRPMNPTDESVCFVQHSQGLYCHIYTNIRLIEPFIFKGAQGWKNVTGADLQRIENVLK